MGSLHALFVEGLWVQIFHFGAAHAGAPAGIEPGELFHLCGNALQFPYGLGTQADEPAPDDGQGVRGTDCYVKPELSTVRFDVVGYE